MQDLNWYINRLRSMGWAEICWRIRSLVRDQLDAIRIKLEAVPRLDSSATGTALSFRPGFHCTRATASDWNDLPDDKGFEIWRTRLLSKAQAVMRNELSYFDLTERFHGDPIQWHRDHSAEKTAPVRLCVKTDYRDFEKNGDCKLVWEPNRHHQLVVLARAYRVTENKEYAFKVHELLESWLNSNPFGYGMNWKSPLEVGVRLINWVYAFDLLGKNALPGDQLWTEILNAVYLSVWDTQRKFSQGSSANNHLIGEAAGVYIACSYFDGLPNATRWKARAKAVLEEEILRQSYPDGCTAEHAFGYQFFVVQFFLYSAMAGDATGDTFSQQFRDRLHLMYRFLSDICADTGTTPNLGDADSGYVLDLGELPSQPSELISVAARYFSDSALERGPASESAFWIFGTTPSPGEALERPLTSSAYPDSGYFIMRAGENETTRASVSVFVDCAELGYGPIAAHGHADCLSICMNVDELPVFVDPGTYDYFTHREWREYFRSTRAHNTAEIDNVSQSESLGPFMYGVRAKAEVLEWTDDSESTVFEGQHDGYCRLVDPVVHTRRVLLSKDSGQVSISDHFDASAHHKVSLYFHVDPAWTTDPVVNNSVVLTAGSSKVSMHTDCGEIQVLEASTSEKLGWISHGYHQKTASACIRISATIDGSTIIHTTVRTNRCVNP